MSSVIKQEELAVMAGYLSCCCHKQSLLVSVKESSADLTFQSPYLHRSTA